MATYYDALGLPPDAPREAIERSLETTQARLRQMGQWEQQRDLFRKIEATLLDPDQRRQYDMQVTLKQALGPSATGAMPAVKQPAPAQKAPRTTPRVSKKGVRRGLLLCAATVLAAGMAYGGWVLYSAWASKVGEGVYLLNPTTGEAVALVLDRDPQHLFPGNTRPAPAVLVYLVQQKKAAWVGEAMVDIQYRRGDPAPPALLEEGREAAKGQDLHQTLR